MEAFMETINCPVCMDTMMEMEVFNCGHSFCSNCTNQLFTNQHIYKGCPVCRAEMTSRTKVVGYGEMIKSFMQTTHEITQVVSRMETEYNTLLVDHKALTEQVRDVPINRHDEEYSKLVDEHIVVVAERDHVQEKYDIVARKLKAVTKVKNKMEKDADSIYRLQADHRKLQRAHDDLIKEHLCKCAKYSSLKQQYKDCVEKHNAVLEMHQCILQLTEATTQSLGRINKYKSDEDDCMVVD
ncbi:RING E3 ubiquitin ligase [European chub iridovirus]|nr:RING E3 ubiquitin ligase [European chub iridovirus]